MQEEQARAQQRPHYPGVATPEHGPTYGTNHSQSIRCSIHLIRLKKYSQGQPIKVNMKNEIRCGNCNRLLAKGQAVNLQIKCPRCGTLNHLNATSINTESQRASTEDSYEDTDRKRNHVPRGSSGNTENTGRL
jgi:phage FluMu protein Com